MRNIFTEEVEITEEQLAEISGGCDGGCGLDTFLEPNFNNTFNGNVSQQSANQGGLLGLSLLNNVDHLLF